MFQRAWLLCHLGMMTEARGSTDQGCPSVYHPGVTLVGQLVGLPKAIGQQGLLDSAVVHALKVDKEHKSWLSPVHLTQRVPAAPLPFGRVLGLNLLCTSCSFSVRGICSQSHPSPSLFIVLGAEFPFLTLSLANLFIFCCASQSAFDFSSEGIAL